MTRKPAHPTDYERKFIELRALIASTRALIAIRGDIELLAAKILEKALRKKL